jgi:hypothetical protein
MLAAENINPLLAIRQEHSYQKIQRGITPTLLLPKSQAPTLGVPHADRRPLGISGIGKEEIEIDDERTSGRDGVPEGTQLGPVESNPVGHA